MFGYNSFTRQGRRAAALLFLSLPVQAGSDMLAAPVRATLSADRVTARPGDTVVATLRLTALEDIEPMTVTLSVSPATPGCMKPVLVPDAKPRRAHRGEAMTLLGRFEVTSRGQCDIVATIVTLDSPKNRFGSVFAVSINRADPVADRSVKRVGSSDGGRMIVAPAGR